MKRTCPYIHILPQRRDGRGDGQGPKPNRRRREIRGKESLKAPPASVTSVSSCSLGRVCSRNLPPSPRESWSVMAPANQPNRRNGKTWLEQSNQPPTGVGTARPHRRRTGGNPGRSAPSPVVCESPQPPGIRRSLCGSAGYRNPHFFELFYCLPNYFLLRMMRPHFENPCTAQAAIVFRRCATRVLAQITRERENLMNGQEPDGVLAGTATFGQTMSYARIGHTSQPTDHLLVNDNY